MASWIEFEKQVPEHAAFGRERFGSQVAYLVTIRPDGSPRVHPVTPIVGKELFLFMEPTSPKGKDLQRDPRYTLHCSVKDMSGGDGEFFVSGRAERVNDPAIREQAVEAAPYSPEERYVLFRLNIQSAFMNTYTEGSPDPQRWRASEP